MSEERAIEMFHSMWDYFPARARLIRRDKLVLAVNAYAANEGMCAGERCCDRPPLESHRHCLANAALEGRTGRKVVRADGTIVFWAPLGEYDELYVHGSIRPEQEEEGRFF